MKRAAVLCVLALALPRCMADDISGPNHVTIRKTAWGSIFYDPVATGPHQFESAGDEFRIKSRKGEVRVAGSEIHGYRLSFGGDLLTIRMINLELVIRWQENTWTWRSQNSGYVLTSTSPKDSVAFERNANAVGIKGALGSVSVSWSPDTLSIKCPAGTASVMNGLGNRTFSGLALDQIPYLGRGVFISFHGIGILIDIGKMFPMPEVAEWNEWKPVIGRPFDPASN